MPNRISQRLLTGTCAELATIPYPRVHLHLQRFVSVSENQESISRRSRHHRQKLVYPLATLERFEIQHMQSDIPLGAHRTTFTAWLCRAIVHRYSTFRSSPSASILHSCCIWSAGSHVTCMTSTYPNIIIPSSRGQSTFSMWLKVSRVYGGILLMPVDDNWCRLHSAGG